MARFADILTAKVKVAPEDLEAITAITAKYPDLDSHIADAQEVQVIQSQLTDTKTKLAKWNDPKDGWLATAWDAEHQMTKAQWAAEQRAAQAEAKVAEMAATGGFSGDGTMTFEEIDAHLKTQGYVKAGDVAKADDLKAIGTKLDTQGANYEYLYTRTAHLPMRAAKEFGDVDGKFLPGVFQVMLADPTGELLKDPDKAYDQYVAPMRLEAERKKLDIERAALATERTELETKKTHVPSPTDDQGGGNVAPYQMREDHPGENPIDKMNGDAKFGSGQLSRNLAAAYKAGDLKTTVQ
jgi:hypothetical protein